MGGLDHSFGHVLGRGRFHICRSEVVSKALDNLNAMSGVIEPFSLTIFDSVFRDTPKFSAISLILIDNGKR